MLEVRTYHKESDTFSGQLETDLFGADFNTVLNNTEPCNYLTFDGKGVNLIDENLKFYEEGDYTGYTLPGLSDFDCEIIDDYIEKSIWINMAPSLDNYPERLTIQFKDDCCKEIKVIYCNKSGVGVKEETVSVSGKFITVTFLRNYYRIYVCFSKTALPYQLVRIESIIYGTINVFNKFKSHNLLEEINVLSDDLPINQFEASFVNRDALPLVKKDALALFSNNKYYGSFYITDVQRNAEFLYDVTAQNSIFILDNIRYKEWGSSGSTAKITEYSGVEFKGNTSYCHGDFKDPSCRMILTGIGFANGFIVDSSRSDSITLKPLPTEISSVILTSDRRIIGDAVFKRADEISSATIEYTCPAVDVETEKTVTITVEKGQRNIYTFDTPISVVSISDSFVISEDMYSVEFIPKAYSVTITYWDFVNITHIETVSNENATVLNEKEFKQLKVEATITKLENGNNIMYPISRAADVEKFIKSRGKVKAKIRLRNERVGDLIQIETAWDGIITGIITKMNITFGYEDIAEIEVLEWPL